MKNALLGATGEAMSAAEQKATFERLITNMDCRQLSAVMAIMQKVKSRRTQGAR